jgi:predicted dienelactone hydrolase
LLLFFRKEDLAFFLLFSSAAQATTGYQTALLPDPGHPPLFVAIWYPTPAPAGAMKLIVMSHGQGGGYAGHVDTALALARAGFVVASLSHTNDTLQAGAQVLQIWDRTRQLHVVTDWVLHGWSGHAHLDPDHIGVFGFSAGGLTALVAAGAVPDLSLVRPHCARHPAEFTCGFIAQADPTGAPLPVPPPGAWVHDRRVRAAVIAAPALGFAFGRAGLAGVRVPVQLWRAAQDEVLPNPFYAQAVADLLPAAPEYHVVAGARHLDFLSPCDAARAKAVPDLCGSLPGFDRAAFHERFNRAVVAFFTRMLRRTDD